MNHKPSTFNAIKVTTCLLIVLGILLSACAAVKFAGIKAPVIAGFVWDDRNHNGIQDEGEPGLADVALKLLSTTTVNTWDGITGADGRYSFTGFDQMDAVLEFKVQVFPPTGWDITILNAGTDPAKDNDFDPSSGETKDFLYTAPEGMVMDAGLLNLPVEQLTEESTATPTSTPTETQTPTVTSTPLANNPGGGTEGINPLTCLPVEDPNSLQYPPGLVSITNFPASARWQAGLDWANWVIEGFIGEGMNRFLAVFHGDFPHGSGGTMDLSTAGDAIGPIRSGRVWFEDWRLLFNGYLIMASGDPLVTPNLGAYTNIYGSDEGDINSALIPIDQLQAIAESNNSKLGENALSGNICDPNPPEGGMLGSSLFTFYAPLNQALWKYVPDLGAYQRYENDTVTGDVFSLMLDRLNETPLSFENIVIVFTNFHGRKDTFFYIDLLYGKGPAKIFRDGQAYNIRWSTEAGEYEKSTGKLRPMRFQFENGDPFPLKPGQTWVLLAPLSSMYTVHETIEEGTYIQRLTQVTPGSGHWSIQIYGPIIEK